MFKLTFSTPGIERNQFLSVNFQNHEDDVNQEAMVDKVQCQANQGEAADRIMAMTGRMEERTITGAIAEMI